MPRVITVSAWMPPLPAMPATTGMKTASATTLLDRVLEEPDDPRGQEAGREIHQHPGQALADRRARRAEDAVLVGEAREVVHVLRRFLGDHVDHVVDGDHAEHAAVDVDHRDREQVVAAHQRRDLLLVGLGAHAAPGRGSSARETGRSRRRRHQPPDRHHAAQAALVVDHVEVEDRVGAPSPAARSESIASCAVIFSSSATKLVVIARPALDSG